MCADAEGAASTPGTLTLRLDHLWVGVPVVHASGCLDHLTAPGLQHLLDDQLATASWAIVVIVWVPLIVGGIVLVVFAINGVTWQVSVKSEADAYGQVVHAYREAGYNPRGQGVLAPSLLHRLTGHLALRVRDQLKLIIRSLKEHGGNKPSETDNTRTSSLTHTPR